MDPAAAKKGNNKSTDLYSFSILAWEVLTGQFTPKITTYDDLLSREHPEFPESVPTDLRKHLSSGFNEDQLSRSSWTEIIISLRKIYSSFYVLFLKHL